MSRWRRMMTGSLLVAFAALLLLVSGASNGHAMPSHCGTGQVLALDSGVGHGHHRPAPTDAAHRNACCTLACSLCLSALPLQPAAGARPVEAGVPIVASTACMRGRVPAPEPGPPRLFS